MITKENAKTIAATNGVYIFYNGSTPIYIGKAVNLRARVNSHIQASVIDQKERLIIENASHIKCIETVSEFEAVILESKLISKYKPQYNIILKDDKSSLYIKVAIHETYPKIFAVRREYDKGALYFGPFETSKQTRYLIRFLRKIIPFCTQKKIDRLPCFYSKIGYCDPCPNIISQSIGAKKIQLTKLYKKNVRRFISILNGKATKVVTQFEKELSNAIHEEDYEKGIAIRNKIFFLKELVYTRSFREYQHIPIASLTKTEIEFKEFMKINFNQILDRSKEYRIECYDISNLFGKDATGSMVVFEGGLSRKDQYRRFRLKYTNRSDFHMLEEVLSRRFKRGGWRNPDLIVIDGGKPQVRTVSKVLNSIGVQIPIIGIAKRPDRFVLGKEPFSPVSINRRSSLFNLIREIRDESHRFAKKYHLLLRHKNMV